LFSALDRTEQVLTLHPQTLTAEWKTPIRYVDEEYEGPMYRVWNEKLDLLVTPNHRFLIQSGKGVRKFKTLGEMSFHDKIPASANWIGEDSTISEDDCALMGIYLAEGCAAGCSGGTTALANGDYTVYFSQTEGIKGGTKGDVRAQIHELLTRMGFSVKESPIGLFVRNKELWEKLRPLGNRYEKRIPKDYRNLPPEKLKILLHWMLLGDGVIRDREQIYYTTSKQLADDVQEIAVKCGRAAQIRVKDYSPSQINGRWIRPTCPLYAVTIFRTQYNHLRNTKHGSYVSTDHYKGRIYCLEVENHVILVRRNGKICWSGNSLYGEDVYAAVMDEFSRAREEAWFALRSTVTQTGAPVRFIGNVKGRGNWGYRLFKQAESGKKNWKFSTITAYDAAKYGIIPYEEIEDAKASLPPHIFNELYLCIPADDGGNPFGLDAIADCLGPLSEKDPVLWGWDLGKSVDWTVGIGLDVDNHVCRFERWQKPWKQTIPEIVSLTGDVPALIDSTGLGDPILEELQGHNPRVFEGFKYSGVSKQQLMEGLALLIQQRRLTFPDGPIRHELETFEYEYTRTGVRYQAASGLHDDCVNALALASWKTVHRPKIHTQNRTAVSEMRDILQTYVPR
jgi:hypothetical protein